MHHKVLVIGPDVSQVLAPFDEAVTVDPYVNADGETTTANPMGRWDWYMVGGAWPGALLHVDGAEVDRAVKRDVDFVGIERRDGQPFSVHAIVAEGVWREPERSLTTDYGASLSTDADLERWHRWVTMFLHGLPDLAVLTVVDCHR